VGTGGEWEGRTHLGDDLGRLAEVGARDWRRGLGEEVLDQPQADVVAHPVQLAVNLSVVAGEVAAQLRDHGAVGERDELGGDLVDLCPVSRSG
jgi:hypothetical protein